MSSRSERSPAVLLLRVLLGVPFVGAGAFSLLNWQATVEFNAILSGTAFARATAGVGALLLIVGGLSVMLGIKARLGALCLLLFLVPASGRHLVAAQEATEMATLLRAEVGPNETVDRMYNLAKRGQLASFAKNIGLAGAVVFLLIGGIEPERSRR